MQITKITALIFCPLVFQGVHASLYGESNLNHTCELKTPHLSCSRNASPSITDSCCTETFGGLVLSTQFWDTYTGRESEDQLLPQNSWTLHGLWPDFCNGSYTQYCDLSRQYDPVPSPNTTTGTSSGTLVPPYTGTPISTIIEQDGKYDLLAYMNKFWIAQDTPNWYLWAHEFSKHATCFSTFDTPCYGPSYNSTGTPSSDLISFYTTALSYFSTLPTYDYLSKHKIIPSNTTTYTLSKLQSALKKEVGAVPYIGCSGLRFNTTAAGRNSTDSGYTVVSEVWYYFHVLGRVQEGRKTPVGADINGGSVSSCATSKGALRYLERAPGSVRGSSGSHELEGVLDS
ncbi:ribonuclease T2 [Sclerotinia borealis F-4128]|uniref:ribonuclease T2 n=1 Tax=Sclerotinia borealis (strain F-4128) TaxID=1432307 RepID=W9CVG2_SCLBF|nr:ribonuclease T2 [Sclerotinia borealis F-4128]